MTTHGREPRMLGCFSIFLLTSLALLLGNLFLTPTYIAEGLVAAVVLMLLFPKAHNWLQRIRQRRKRRRRIE